MAKLLNTTTILLNKLEIKYFSAHVRNLSRFRDKFSDNDQNTSKPLNYENNGEEVRVNEETTRDSTYKTIVNTDEVHVANNVYFGVQSIRVLKGYDGKPNLYTLFISAFVNKRQQFIVQQYFYANSALKNADKIKLWFLCMNILYLRDFHTKQDIINYWNVLNTECGTHLFLDHTYNMQTVSNTMRKDRSLLTSPRAYINEVIPQFSHNGNYYVARKYMISAAVRESDGYRISSRFERLFGFGGVFDLKTRDIIDTSSKWYIRKYLGPEMASNFFAVYVSENAKLIVCDELHEKAIPKDYQSVLFGKYGDYINSRTLFLEKSLALFEGTVCISMCETGVYHTSDRFSRLKRIKYPVFIVGHTPSKYDSLCWSVSRMNATDKLYSGQKTDWCFRFPQNYNLIDIVEFDAFESECRNGTQFFDCRHISRDWPKFQSHTQRASVIQCVDGIHSVRFEDLRFKGVKQEKEPNLDFIENL